MLRYKGGGGKLGSDPVPFLVPEDEHTPRTGEVHASTSSATPGVQRSTSGDPVDRSILKDPQSLLAALNEASTEANEPEAAAAQGAQPTCEDSSLTIFSPHSHSTGESFVSALDLRAAEGRWTTRPNSPRCLFGLAVDRLFVKKIVVGGPLRGCHEHVQGLT